MNRIKIHHPVGFFDQYIENGLTDEIVMTFLTQMQSELNARECGISIFVDGRPGGQQLSANGIGMSIFVTNNSI